MRPRGTFCPNTLIAEMVVHARPWRQLRGVLIGVPETRMLRVMGGKHHETDAILRELRLAYPGAHTKSPWPGHLDLAVRRR